jgi:hypothetical protein
MPLTFTEVDLTPHVEEGESSEGLQIAASDDAIWAMLPRCVLRIAPDGAVQRALGAPGSDVFVALSAAGRHVAVATYDKALFVARDGGTFTSVRSPKRGRRTSVDSLFSCADGGLWLELGVGQPVRPAWWYRRPDGSWEEQRDPGADRLVARYGLLPEPLRVESPILSSTGTIVALEDRRESNPAADRDPDAPLYLRRQTLLELTPKGWTPPCDLEAAGLAPIESPKDPYHPTWIHGVALAAAADEGEPVWLVARPDALFRVWRGRAQPIALRASALVSDGERIVLAIERVDERDILHLSQDAGRTFSSVPSMPPRQLGVGGPPHHRPSATFFRGRLVLGWVARERPSLPPTRAWIVAAG